MLGITVPDAIAVGALVAAVLAGLVGKRAGEQAKKSLPPEPVSSGIAAGFVDKDLMVRLVLSNESIAKTLKTYLDIQTDKHEQAVEKLLLEIKAKLPD